MKTFLNFLQETKDFVNSSKLIDRSAEAESRDKSYTDLALGAVGLDRPAQLEREKEKVDYNWSRSVGLFGTPIVSPYSKVRGAQAHQKEIAGKVDRENKTGILEPDTLHQAETELQRIGSQQFKEIYGKDQALMRWLNTRPVNEDQEFTSAGTSQSQVAKGFGVVAKHVGWEPGTVNLDLGGGRYDHAVRFLQGHDVESHVLDPYNRPAEHNERVKRLITERGGADTVTVFNVLNTIKEPKIHEDILRSAKQHLKPGGRLYLSVYAGDKSGTGRQTKTDSWQRNEPIHAYLETVRKHFPDAVIRHGIIHATND